MKIIQSFIEDMKAQVRIDGQILKKITVDNGLWQVCTLAPTLFNPYACLVAERWKLRVKDINVEGVGLHFYHKIDGKLFYTIE